MKTTHWENMVQKYQTKPWNCLEIGSYEGRSTVWILENIKESTLTCIDTFEGSIEHTDDQKSGIHERFLENTSAFRDRMTVHVGQSKNILKKLDDTYDFIYVDGSHEFKDVIYDAFLAWDMLKPGGVIVFDDMGLFEGVTNVVNILAYYMKPEIAELWGGYDQVFILKK